jgi:hypothetical protein
MSCTILLGIPWFLNISHRLSLCRLPNAFSNSTKLTSNCLCHSRHCSKMILRRNMRSMQPLSFLNPASYCQSFLSTTSVILNFKIMQKTFLGMDSKVIPLQLLQLVKSPDFGILMMLPSHQLLGITASSYILWNTGCKVSTARTGSILINSAFNWYVPGFQIFNGFLYF